MDFNNKKEQSNASERDERELAHRSRKQLTRSHVTEANFDSQSNASEQWNGERVDTSSPRISHETRSHASPEEHFLAEILSQITERLKQKYNYSDEEILKLWNNGNEILVPVVIFANGLSPAETLAKFLKENHRLSYDGASKLIGIHQRSIWANYKRAAKKMPAPFQISNGISVPVSVFNSEKSVLEALVSYLKDVKKMRNRKIAQLLSKNPSNIWTLYKRAKSKENNRHKNEK